MLKGWSQSALLSAISEKLFFAIPVHCEKFSVKRGKVLLKFKNNGFSKIWLLFNTCTDKDVI